MKENRAPPAREGPCFLGCRFLLERPRGFPVLAFRPVRDDLVDLLLNYFQLFFKKCLRRVGEGCYSPPPADATHEAKLKNRATDVSEAKRSEAV